MKTKRAVAAIVLLAGLPGIASACSCVGGSFQEKLDHAKAVVLVRVLETKLNAESLLRVRPEDPGPVRATFELVETLKGEATSIKELASWYGGGDCGMALLPGLYYLVLAAPKDRVVPVSICSGTMELGALDPREDPQTFAQRRLHAAMNYFRNRKPIDPSMDERNRLESLEDSDCNRKSERKLSEGSSK